MSDTEVTVTQSESKQWWKLEYRGRYEFTDENPSEDEKREFRRNIDRRAKESQVEAKVRARIANGESTIREEAGN